MFHLISCDSC